MIGFLLSEKEGREFKYLLEKEMEELLLDLADGRIDEIVKQAMEERYGLIFRMYARIADSRQISKYVRNKKLQ